MMDAIGPDVVRQLQFTPLFGGLAGCDLAALLEGARLCPLGEGEALFREGEAVTHFHVLLDGHVELSVEAEGRRSVVAMAKRLDMLGDADMFGDGRHLMSARALAGGRVVSIPADGFRARLEGRMDLMVPMLASMSVRLRMLVRQIAELKLKTTAQRLGSFLLSLAEVEAGRVELRFPYDKRRVADQLGMKPESLSRALAKLARLGVESRSDGVVAIDDLDTLRAFCAEEEA